MMFLRLPHALVNWIQRHLLLVRFPVLCVAQFKFSSGDSGHMFNNVATGDHTVTVSCATNSVMISRSVDISVSGKV